MDWCDGMSQERFNDLWARGFYSYADCYGFVLHNLESRDVDDVMSSVPEDALASVYEIAECNCKRLGDDHPYRGHRLVRDWFRRTIDRSAGA